MTIFHSIYLQYFLETAVLAGLTLAVLYPALRRRDPRKVLAVLVGLNLLRFGGVAGALAAVGHAPKPAFLVAVAIGDGLTATLALVAFVLLLRRSAAAPLAVAAMNVVGLAGILASESWLEYMQLAGDIPHTAGIHGPTIGAAFFTIVHLLAFAVLRRDARVSARPAGAR
jgi:hypothetical protein